MRSLCEEQMFGLFDYIIALLSLLRFACTYRKPMLLGGRIRSAIGTLLIKGLMMIVEPRDISLSSHSISFLYSVFFFFCSERKVERKMENFSFICRSV